ncbi:MAG TPA: ACT domain-containing protein [Verrucomicrobiae bacterium]|nr:ACT domain-containing protein [Verrucomicrobiae bacterium]
MRGGGPPWTHRRTGPNNPNLTHLAITEEAMPHAVISVTGNDKPGIIAEVTGVLFKQKGNLEDVSMTILEREFAMILIVSLAAGGAEPRVRKALEALGRRAGLSINWKRLARAKSKKQKATDRYILTAAGKDRTGIVYHVSRFFAGRRLNITDLNSKIVAQGRQGIYVLVLEVDVPRGFSKRTIEAGLEKLRRSLRIDIHWKPVESLRF